MTTQRFDPIRGALPRPALRTLLLGLGIVFLSTAAFAGGNANFIYGIRELHDDAWEPTDEQDVYGLTVDFGGKNWPVYLAISYFESEDEGELASFPILGAVDLESEMSEWDIGVRKIWQAGSARPFMGGGVAFIDADAEVESALGTAADGDDTEGIYVEGGISWRLGEAFNLGVHGRIVEGTDVTIFDQEGDADHWQLGALFGFGWK